MADMGIGEIAAAAAISAALSVGTSLAMGALNPNVKGKLDSLFISTSTYGISIPRGWGTARYSGNLIWCAPIRETSHTGKGATTKTKTYEYLTSFAYAFCAGPAEEVLRVWADGHLIYDATGTGTVEHNLSLAMNWHNGSEDQLPDPAIEADKGVGQVPAFRGLVYIVASNVDLNAFGGRLPSISAEIAFNGTGDISPVALTPVAEPLYSAYTALDVAFDWKRKQAYRAIANLAPDDLSSALSVVNLVSMTEAIQHPYNDILGTGETGPGTGHSIEWLATGSGQDVFAQSGTTNSNKIYVYDKDGLAIVYSYGENSSRLSNLVGTNVVFASGIQALSVPAVDGGSIEFLAVASNLAGFLVIDGTTFQYVWGARYIAGTTPTTDYLEPLYTGSFARNAVVPGAQHVGSADLWTVSGNASPVTTGKTVRVEIVSVSAGATYLGGGASIGVSPRHIVDISRTGIFLSGEGDDAAGVIPIRAEYDEANDALLLVLAASDNTQRLVSVAPSGTIMWNYKTTGGTDFGPLSGKSRLNRTSFAWLGPSSLGGGYDLFVIDTRTGTITRQINIGALASAFSHQVYDASNGWLFLWGGSQFLKLFVASATGSPQALSTVVSDLCIQSGLDGASFDVTELTDDVPGFTCQQESARKSIEQLAAAYFFDAVEHDDVLTFRKRGRDVSADISYTDLKRVQNGENTIKPIIQPELETPRRITVRWPDPLKDYQQNATHVTRTQQPSTVATIASIGENVVDLRVTLARNDAKNIAMRGLLQAWREREKYTDIQVGPKYLALEPTDVVNLNTRSGDQIRVRITKTEIGANWAVKLSGTVEDERLWAVTANAADGGDVMSPIPFAGDYAVRAVVGNQFPLLRDEDDTAGTALRSYTAAGTYSGDISGWRGATVSVAPDDATWATLSTESTPMRYGLAQNTLGAPVSPWLRDGVNSLTVRMIEGADHLETATTLQVMNGANPAALINARTGAAEIIQYETVTALGGGLYTLSGLYRGRRGSDWACDEHGVGDIFLLLEADTIVPVTRPLADLSATRFVRATSPFQPLDSVSSQSLSWPGAAEKPYSPVHIEGARDGSDNLTITWVRRTRLGGEWVDGIEDVPLSEASEAYQVDVFNVTGGIVRTITGLSSATTTYSAANQTTDGLTPGDPVHVKVYQMSATVGRGYPGDATV